MTEQTTTIVPLTQSKVALIDAEDAERVMAFKWCAVFVSGRWRAVRNPKTKQGRTPRLMHRFILDAKPGVLVDHKNGDGLDNRRSNLRECDPLGNARNARRWRGRDGFKGVRRRSGCVKWDARIRVDGAEVYLGAYLTPEEAATAYDEAAREHFGEFACVNFPRDSERGARS